LVKAGVGIEPIPYSQVPFPVPQRVDLFLNHKSQVGVHHSTVVRSIQGMIETLLRIKENVFKQAVKYLLCFKAFVDNIRLLI